MKRLNKILFVLIFLAGSSCNDILEKEPESNLSPSQFYKNADDAKAAVSAVYDIMLSEAMYSQAMWIVLDQSTDDAEWGGGRSTANPPKNDLDKYTFTPQTVTFYSIWTACYQGINRANAAIGRIPGITMEEGLKARLVGEAKFMRGFYYFTLVRLFGGVPLVLKETTSLNNLEIARSSEEEVYVQIIQDFSDAEAILPLKGLDENGKPVSVDGRATKGSATAFLAKVYLTKEDWPNAALKAKEVIDSNIYGLWENYSDVFLIANENGKESIFDIQAISGGAGEGSYMQGYQRPNFDRVNGTTGFGDNPPTKNLYDTYTERNDTLRRNATLRLFTENTTPAKPASVTFGCYVYKYTDPTATGNKDGGNNYPLMRYADVLLMYAEALNEQGAGNGEAYNAINEVRNRAGLADLATGLTQDQFRDSVLLERRLELAFEGHRRYDLIRTKRLISAIKEQNPDINVQEHHYLLPIPQRERDVNPKLEQNPVY
ncbi:MAG TPA: RagB/SusD family nutrient uptake outer membrane protein [Cytophagales bacterium]|nr:RagB/SusD family nutrient uptake outer membrane protein [Cytophagales bacterium]